MKRKRELDQGNEILKKFTIDCNETSSQINHHSIFDKNILSQNEKIKTHAGEEMEQEYSLERMEALNQKAQYVRKICLVNTNVDFFSIRMLITIAFIFKMILSNRIYPIILKIMIIMSSTKSLH